MKGYPGWAQGDTAQYHIALGPHARLFLCGVPYTAVTAGPYPKPPVTDYYTRCPECHRRRGKMKGYADC